MLSILVRLISIRPCLLSRMITRIASILSISTPIRFRYSQLQEEMNTSEGATISAVGFGNYLNFRMNGIRVSDLSMKFGQHRVSFKTPSRACPIPVVRIPLALPAKPQIDHKLNRTDFGLPYDVFIFLFTFDFASVVE